MNRKTLSISLLVAALGSLVFSHLGTFSFIMPKATRAIMAAHDVFEKNAKEPVSKGSYIHAYVFDLRDSVVIIVWAESFHIGIQVLSGVLFLSAFVVASIRPNQSVQPTPTAVTPCAKE